ncbi:MAG: hypothetical protein PVH82_12895 [Desulfobacteraceae bacterium]
MTESKDSCPCPTIKDQEIGGEDDHQIHIKEAELDMVAQIPFDEEKKKGCKPY